MNYFQYVSVLIIYLSNYFGVVCEWFCKFIFYIFFSNLLAPLEISKSKNSRDGIVVYCLGTESDISSCPLHERPNTNSLIIEKVKCAYGKCPC